jgi:cell division septum initiation protein DivIVA
LDQWVEEQPAMPWDEAPTRFPIAHQGYDCASVDQHVADLEQELGELDGELAQLRAQALSRDDVAAEIERIGEQTSAILIAAHDQAEETKRLAQGQAERCVADAAANAIATTSEANRELRELESEKAALGYERERLLEDIRGVAAALSSLADNATERFPPEQQQPGPPRQQSTPADTNA